MVRIEMEAVLAGDRSTLELSDYYAHLRNLHHR